MEGGMTVDGGLIQPRALGLYRFIPPNHVPLRNSNFSQHLLITIIVMILTLEHVLYIARNDNTCHFKRHRLTGLEGGLILNLQNASVWSAYRFQIRDTKQIRVLKNLVPLHWIVVALAKFWFIEKSLRRAHDHAWWMETCNILYCCSTRFRLVIVGRIHSLK